MDKRYIFVLSRWLWLIVVVTIISGLTAYIAIKDQPRIYEAKAKLLVGPGIDAPNPDINSLRTGGQLMQTYAELVHTGPFLQSIIYDLNIDLTSDELQGMIGVRSNQETQILNITVQHPDPGQAIAIANAAADALVKISPSANDSPTSLLNDQMRGQAARLEQIISSSDSTIERLESDLRDLTGEESQGLIVLQTENYLEKQRLIIQQLSEERGRLSDALSAVTLLYDSLQVAPTNQVKIVEPAVTSVLVISQLRLTVLVAAIAGSILAIISALAFEYFDDTIKTAGELEREAGLPLLGIIPSSISPSHLEPRRLIVAENGDSRIAQIYQMLGTKLLANIGDVPYGRSPLLEKESVSHEKRGPHQKGRPKTLLIASSQIDDDYREFVANLAIVLSHSDRRVVLIDADLNGSILDQILNLGNRPGISDLLSRSTSDFKSCVVPWSDKLSVVPAGSIQKQDGKYQSFKLLASNKMKAIIEGYGQEADIVIIVAPPLLSSADGFILASYTDGVILITRKGGTKREGIRSALENLHALNVPIIGLVFDENSSQGGSILSRLGIDRIFNQNIFSNKSSVHKSESVLSIVTARKSEGKVLPLDDTDKSGHEIFPIRTAKS